MIVDLLPPSAALFVCVCVCACPWMGTFKEKKSQGDLPGPLSRLFVRPCLRRVGGVGALARKGAQDEEDVGLASGRAETP